MNADQLRGELERAKEAGDFEEIERILGAIRHFEAPGADEALQNQFPS